MSVAVAALVALGVISCGGEDDDATPGPAPGGEAETAEPPAVEPPAPPPGTPPGEYLVVDLRGRALARPERLEFASDATLTGLRWSGWGEERAQATGEAEILVCQPTCADGRLRRQPAAVVLSEPVDCDGVTYYGAAEVRSGEGSSQAPAAYIEAPC